MLEEKQPKGFAKCSGLNEFRRFGTIPLHENIPSFARSPDLFDRECPYIVWYPCVQRFASARRLGDNENIIYQTCYSIGSSAL